MLLQNEAMGGFLLFVGPFSRMTFGLFEDSGYVLINFDLVTHLDYNADGMFLIMNLHKSLPGAETEVAVFLMEAVLSTSRTSKQG